ncbi:cadherin-15-like [Megalops cyprinoides]|uniref:cadherin-15-like n=1 Tax=Megalops cyprinoides TaxID=118141 RepID=UPI001863B473|nr:cadherin-15-like [Megalops cyprinoides]
MLSDPSSSVWRSGAERHIKEGLYVGASIRVGKLGACSLVSCITKVVQEEPKQSVLYPWRRAAGGTSSAGHNRVKRDWIIPPIRVSENSKHVPEYLVQIKSDKVFTSEVIYKLEGPGVDQEPKDFFEIEDRTGWIKSKMPLDREKYSSFKLKAFALSPSGERLENPSTIEIVVLDQNDNRPDFTQNEFVGFVPEFSIPGTAVTNVSATDADDPATENAALSYSIIRQESIPPFSINKTMFGINNETGMIYTRDVGLDREVVKAFRLTLQVADMSGEGLSDVASAVIHVSDINNHMPRFTKDYYTMRAVENRVEDTGRISVTDKDEPGTANWKVKYTIAKGDPSGHFAIRTDPSTNEGVISVVTALDYESQKEHHLILTVENEAPLSSKAPHDSASSATVTIMVTNENEAPKFRSDPISLEVPESIVPGTVLVQDIAYDPDNSDLSYEIEYDPEKWLSINPETGVLITRQAFNLRSLNVKNNIYYAVIKVTDKDNGGVSNTATVEITLLETNDFPPQLFPLSGTVCLDLANPGLVLSARDQDQSPQAEPFTFELSPDSDASLNWTISQVNGTHALLQPLTDMNSGLYFLSVLVSDAGTPTLSNFHIVNVTVCHCDMAGECKAIAAAFLSTRVGLSFTALLIIIGSILLLLLLLLLVVAIGNCRRPHIAKGGLLGGVSDDDIRDNILNYDEQGGGEEDENAYNIEQLRNPNEVVPPPISALPRGKQPLRKDAPHNLPSPSYPRKPPGDPTDIEDFINDGLDAADNDPNVPPYDTALIYDYEGDGSLAGSLSSIASGSSDGDQDYDYLNEWGPRFKKLADMYDPR